MKRILEVKKKIGTLSKTETNPFFKSKYLDLNSLLEAVEPLLWEQGLILLQPVNENGVCSIIKDSETNQTVCESFIQLPNITDPQKLGSAITYFRRYTLKSLLAISEEDDDGNKASQPEPKKKQKLTKEGFDYLITKGSAIDIKNALDNRLITSGNTRLLNEKLIKLEDGSK
jgi:hypothetical protein